MVKCSQESVIRWEAVVNSNIYNEEVFQELLKNCLSASRYILKRSREELALAFSLNEDELKFNEWGYLKVR